MRIALISTVFNEGDSVFRWAKSLRSQTRTPDEFVIVDGGSTDGTPDLIRQSFQGSNFPEPQILVERCNIARGRNLAIQNTTAEIVACTDAGSFPEPNWLYEITQPLLEDSTLDAVGGKTVRIAENEFQEFLLEMEGQTTDEEGYSPSSRNIAVRRATWEAVGGYPEWLTLAGEDSLYNCELQSIGKRFAASKCARVEWPMRPTPEAYFKLLYRNAFGAAEARLFTSYFIRPMLVAALPPLLLLSRYRFSHLKFRFRKNASSALGWVAGMFFGRRPPPGWRRHGGVLLSPEAQRFLQVHQVECPH